MSFKIIAEFKENFWVGIFFSEENVYEFNKKFKRLISFPQQYIGTMNI
jgi:hypothetical protein